MCVQGGQGGGGDDEQACGGGRGGGEAEQVDQRRHRQDTSASAERAERPLEADRSIGLLLPCNVVVRRESDHVPVQALDPDTVVALTGLDAMKPVAAEATARLDAALSALAPAAGGR
ncbi:DUF302 domain-containing protein [Streptomyces sp. NBC_00390]|uniref:DUF302 domain-containing protein n=1 Tax=Streptomyces sp. NBC_00390 TaxID=2975736 RepID=UPI002E1ABE09